MKTTVSVVYKLSKIQIGSWTISGTHLHNTTLKIPLWQLKFLHEMWLRLEWQYSPTTLGSRAWQQQLFFFSAKHIVINLSTRWSFVLDAAAWASVMSASHHRSQAAASRTQTSLHQHSTDDTWIDGSAVDASTNTGVWCDNSTHKSSMHRTPLMYLCIYWDYW